MSFLLILFPLIPSTRQRTHVLLPEQWTQRLGGRGSSSTRTGLGEIDQHPEAWMQKTLLSSVVSSKSSTSFLAPAAPWSPVMSHFWWERPLGHCVKAQDRGAGTRWQKPQ